MSRRILVIAHPGRSQALAAVDLAVETLSACGTEPVTDFVPGKSDPVDAALILGGDGTILHAVELTRGSDVPLLGVNFGRVGFLTEAERDNVEAAARALAEGDFTVEERGTLELTMTRPDGSVEHGWALNETTVERAVPRRTLGVFIEVDRRPLSAFGCDGVVVSTATGSTAHAFSAGGPVIWPDVDALLFVPLAAHALFSRPLVVGPETIIGIRVAPTSSTPATAVCDGARAIEVPIGGLVEVRRGSAKVHLAHLTDSTFTERLVEKFRLPTKGWRGELADTDTEG
ncbi:MAG: NAD kinase [Demequinaceae bacterium]|nr:NAD kinase [Demequinaceae bacterium]